jgi:hypothetical protein
MNQFAAGRNGSAIAPNGPILLPCFGCKLPSLSGQANVKGLLRAVLFTTPRDRPSPTLG